MQPSTLWTACTIAGLAVLGAAGGLWVLAAGGFDEAQFAAALFVALFVSSVMGAQLYRRSLGQPVLVAGLAGGAGMLAFFAAPLWLIRDEVAPRGAFMLLAIAPLVTGALSAAGALFLARGVDRYRREHGMVHAPK